MSATANYQVVRYKRGGKKYEIPCTQGKVKEWREKKETKLENVVQGKQVYTHLGKGERPSEAELAEAFGTNNMDAILAIILEKGDLQLNAEDRKELVEQKRRAIVTHLHKHYINPKTQLPHPVVRIDGALDELKYHVDPDVPVERQVLNIVRDLPSILPIRKALLCGQLSIPTAHVAAAHGLFIFLVHIFLFCLDIIY